MTETPAPYGSEKVADGFHGHNPRFASQRTEAEQLARLTELAPAVGVDLMLRIAAAIAAAPGKHPSFARDYDDAVRQVAGELLEWGAKAIVRRREDAEDEAFDGIAVFARFIRRDYEEDRRGA